MRYYPELQSKPWKDFFYYPLDIILGKELMNSEVCGNSIMIGNSASGTNNHEYVMRILSKLDIGLRRVIVRVRKDMWTMFFNQADCFWVRIFRRYWILCRWTSIIVFSRMSVLPCSAIGGRKLSEILL